MGLNTQYPKIGIRPTIDGRRLGVRESLEEQTMNMAKQVAELYSSTLRYPNGEAVECVIADSTIGGVAEAARCADKFSREGVGLTVTVTPCWCYGSETIDMDPHRPKAIWGFNGTERPGAVYLAAALSGHSQFGLPAFGIYGRDVQDANMTEIPEDVKEKLLRFARAGLAVAEMKGKSYLSIGSVAMGIAGSIVDQKFFQKYLGMRNEYVDMSEVNRRLDRGIYDPVEYKKALAWVKENCKEGTDKNAPQYQRTREEKDKIWETVVKMTLIAKFVLATENDSLNGVAMLFGHLLTNTAQLFSDVRTYWSPDAVKRVTGKELTGRAANGIIHLINSGATTLDATGRQNDSEGNPALKPFWEITESEVKDCLDATRWWPAVHEYFRGGGYSSKFLSKAGMPMTMSRVCLIDGLGPVLQIAEGYTVELDPEVHKTIDNRTDSSWPTTWFAPNITGEGAFKDVYSVMNNWGANHGAISYGHIGADLITLASMLRIPVAMHNVPEEKIFRPSTAGMFGTKDLESADFRFCQNFGPLYK